jgi:hypothetical protein
LAQDIDFWESIGAGVEVVDVGFCAVHKGTVAYYNRSLRLEGKGLGLRFSLVYIVIKKKPGIWYNKK